MNSACVIYKSRPDATPDSEREALATVYAFVLEAHAKKSITKQSGQDDAQGEEVEPPLQPMVAQETSP